MNKTRIPVPVIQAVVDYLATRPYSEVHQLLASLVGAARAGMESEIPKKHTPGETP